MAGNHAFRDLQLRILRILAKIILVVIVVWSLTVSEEETALVQALRTATVAYLLLVLAWATETTAWKCGVVVTLAIKAIMTTRTFDRLADPDAFLNAVTAGPNRVLPVLCALFGGIHYSLAMSAWSCAEVLGVFLLKREWADDRGGGSWTQHPSGNKELAIAMLGVEFYYVAVAATCGCALVHYYKIALNELGEALLARQRFITNMNHEIRTPLVGVLSLADVMLRQPNRLPEPTSSHLQTIVGSTNALLAIINNIVDASKLQFHMMRFSVSEVNVARVVTSVMETFRALATVNKIPTRVILDPEMPSTVETDGTHLHHILSNLIGNAIKFNSAGGVTVIAGLVDASDGRLKSGGSDFLYPHPLEHANDNVGDSWAFSRSEVDQMAMFHATQSLRSLDHAHRTAGLPRLWFKITDRGIGIAPNDMSRIVEPFQQADNTITRRYGGSGLGLSIVRDLVLLLGGDLVYGSCDGKGSIFVITIPCSVRPGTPRTRVPEPPSPSVTSLRRMPSEQDAARDAPDEARHPVAGPTEAAARPMALVADDNHINVTVLQRQLEQLGVDSVVATNGREAVDMVRRHLAPSETGGPATDRRIDLVFMDLHMPIMDGLEATRTIRALEAATRPLPSPIPVISTSADDPSVVGLMCREAGMQDYLRKPIVLDDLSTVLGRWIPVHDQGDHERR